MEPESSLPRSQEPSTGPISWARSIQSIPSHHISRRSILILFTHLRLSLPSGRFLLAFPPISYMHSAAPPIHSTCPTHLTLLDFIILILLGEEYKLWSFSLCSYLRPPVTSSLFDPNIPLSTLFSNTPSLYFSQVSVAPNVFLTSHIFRVNGCERCNWGKLSGYVGQIKYSENVYKQELYAENAILTHFAEMDLSWKPTTAQSIKLFQSFYYYYWFY
jgi:hypothetical protein